MRKMWYFKFLPVLLFAAGSCFFTSCVDESVDLNNLSGDIEVGGVLKGPLVMESELSLESILLTYNPNVPDLRIDVTSEGNICLVYEKSVAYSLSMINDYFRQFEKGMSNDFGIHNMLSGVAATTLLGVEAGVLPASQTHDYPFSFDISGNLSDTEGLINKQKFTKIQFEYTDVELTVEPTFEIKSPNVLKLELITSDNADNPGLPPVDVKNGSNSYIFPYTGERKFEIAKDHLVARFTVKGDGQTQITAADRIRLRLSFKRNDNDKFQFITYGWFNYSNEGEIGLKIEDYVADIWAYMERMRGSELSLEEPEFSFWAESNIGVPFQFRIDKLESTLHPNVVKIYSPSEDPFILQRTLTPGVSVVTDHTNGFKPINKDFFEAGGADISDFITTRLKSLRFAYGLSTSEIPDLDNPGVPEEFIPSNGELRIHGRLSTPLAFDAGSHIFYADTIALPFDSEYFDNASLIILKGEFTNNCPLGFFADVYLLNENKQRIANKPYQQLKFERPEVYTSGPNKGQVVREKVAAKGFEIEFKQGENPLSDLRKAKYILLEYSSEKTPSAVKEDNYIIPNAAPIRLMKDDSIKIKIGFIVNGKILFSI